MNIYLHVGENPHTIYQELIRYPPVQYVNYPDNTVVSGYSQPSSCSRQSSMIKSSTRRLVVFAQKHGVPIFGYVRDNDVDLIHAGTNIPLNHTPWVVDFAHAASLLYNRRKNADSFMSKWLLKKYLSSKYCKKIMPWSFAARNSLASIIDISDIEEKIEVVYPAIHEVEFKKNKDNGKTKILFIGGLFYAKGGYEVLKAFEILDGKYDIELTMVSQAPDDIIKKYEKYDNINIFGILPREILLNKYYPESDIFVYPTHFDDFGMVFLEAMAFGLPIVATSSFVSPEIVEDGVNGFLIKPYSKQWFGKDYLHDHVLGCEINLTSFLKNELSEKERNRMVNDIVNKLAILIEDSSLRKRMGDNAYKMITHGKPSIKERNRKLKKIYEEAVQ